MGGRGSKSGQSAGKSDGGTSQKRPYKPGDNVVTVPTANQKKADAEAMSKFKTSVKVVKQVNGYNIVKVNSPIGGSYVALEISKGNYQKFTSQKWAAAYAQNLKKKR